MNKLTIKENICKGCGICIQNCPLGLLRLSPDRLNTKGYRPAEITDMDKCRACALCAIMCPDVAIKVEKNV